MGLAATALLLALAVTWWPRPGAEDAPRAAPASQRALPASEVRPPAPPAPSPPPPAPPAPVSLAATGEALSAALNEERVSLTSSVVVEGIDMDRPWVCAGETMGLSARLGGEPEPGAVYRWVWPVAGSGAELHPGPTLQWRAPETAGRYRVRFQVCTDLGGRRVGVLAEREVELDVRQCGEQEAQRNEPLRIAAVQQGQARFAFQALYQGGARVVSYAWDFGNGTASSPSEPRIEHS